MFRFAKAEKTLDTRKYSGQYHTLAGKLLRYCCAETGRKNVFISPLSVLILLSIAADSTAGQTRREILDFLGTEDAGLILSRLQKELCGRSLSAVNAVCVRKDIAPKINRSYTELQLPQYIAKVFSSDDMVQKINEWVNWATRGMISNAAPESVKDVLMCLINAIAFESDWADPYEDEDVKDFCFHNADGSESRVWMLCGSEDEFYENNDFIGFRKAYQDNNLSFMALLPQKEGETALSDALSRLDFSKLRHSDAIVRTKLPEFKFEFSQELSGLCKSFGMQELFSDYADFSPVTSEPLKVETILHKAYIDVNQKGTKAAALTMAVCCAGCAPREIKIKEVYLDRPFVFAIIHNRTGIPVFTGVIRHLDDMKQDPERLKRNLERSRRLRNQD